MTNLNYNTNNTNNINNSMNTNNGLLLNNVAALEMNTKNTINAEETKGNKTMTIKKLNSTHQPIRKIDIVKRILEEMENTNSVCLNDKQHLDLIEEVFPEFLDTELCEQVARYHESFDLGFRWGTDEKDLLKALIRIDNTTGLTPKYFLNILKSNSYDNFVELYEAAQEFPIIEEMDCYEFFHNYVIEWSEEPEAIEKFWQNNFMSADINKVVKWMFENSDWRLEEEFTYNEYLDTVVFDRYTWDA